MSNFYALDSALRPYCSYRLRFKDEGPWRWVFAALGLVFPRLRPDHVSTIGSSVWFPRRTCLMHYGEAALAREFVRLWDYADGPWQYYLRYYAPQALALACLPALLFSGTLGQLLLLALAAVLAATPSPWRPAFDAREHAMRLAYHYWTVGTFPDLEQLSEQLQRRSPWRHDASDRVLAGLKDIQSQLLSEQLQRRGPYRIVHEFLRQQGRLTGG